MMQNQLVAEAAGTAVADAAAVSPVPFFLVQVGLPIRVVAPAEETVES
jgi:hypothetical protein